MNATTRDAIVCQASLLRREMVAKARYVGRHQALPRYDSPSHHPDVPRRASRIELRRSVHTRGNQPGSFAANANEDSQEKNARRPEVVDLNDLSLVTATMRTGGGLDEGTKKRDVVANQPTLRAWRGTTELWYGGPIRSDCQWLASFHSETRMENITINSVGANWKRSYSSRLSINTRLHHPLRSPRAYSPNLFN